MSNKPVHTEQFEGFEINVYFEQEDTSPADLFDSTVDDINELYRKIENGTLLWFCAKVTASKAGVVLGTDYLGGCCYESVADFITEDGYYPDMRNTAVTEARTTILELAK